METSNMPRLIDNVREYMLFEKKNTENLYSIGSIEADRYIEVKESVKEPILRALEYFDGTNTLEEISLKLSTKDNISIDIYKLYELFLETGLILGEEEKMKKGEIQKLSIKLFEIDISSIRGLRLFDYISKAIIIAIILLLPLTFMQMRNHFNMFLEMNSFRVNGSYVLGYLILILSATFSIGIHEFAHAITAKKYGLTPTRLVFSLYMFISPMIYIKIPGIYTIKPINRVKIWAAGVVTNLFLASMAMVVIPFASGKISNICFIFAFLNIVLVISNLCPFLPLDGYFIMTTLMKLPNLRKRSFKELRKFINKKDNNLSLWYMLYVSIALLIMGGLIYTQLLSCIRGFIHAYNVNYSLLEALWGIKVYIIIITFILINRYRKARSFLKAA